MMLASTTIRNEETLRLDVSGEHWEKYEDEGLAWGRGCH
jgi:hypothetical protein